MGVPRRGCAACSTRQRSSTTAARKDFRASHARSAADPEWSGYGRCYRECSVGATIIKSDVAIARVCEWINTYASDGRPTPLGAGALLSGAIMAPRRAAQGEGLGGSETLFMAEIFTPCPCLPPFGSWRIAAEPAES